MKKKLLFLLLLCILPLAQASINGVSYDTFGNNSNCQGSIFDCGNLTDNIIAQNLTFEVNLTTNDNLSTMICATFISGSNATTKSCLIRNGFTNTSCDSFSAVNGGNKSDYYLCPPNMNDCGWNNQNGIPLFGNKTPKHAFQINTSLLADTRVIFISYICNGTPNSSFSNPSQHFIVTNTKGILCNNLNYQSIVYSTTGITNLGGLQSCPVDQYCDPALQTNYTMNTTMNGTFCTGGCNDNIKDGGETETDYGGIICGNCTTTGKTKDEYYPLAKELQQQNTTKLNPLNQFDNTNYCPVSQQVIGAITMQFFIILIAAAILLLALLTIITGSIILIIVGIGKYLKTRRGKT